MSDIIDNDNLHRSKSFYECHLENCERGKRKFPKRMGWPPEKKKFLPYLT